MEQELIQQAIEESWSLIQRRQTAPAVELLSGLITQMPPRGPQYEVACSHLSYAYRQMGKVKKAISSLRHAIRSSPRNARYRLHLALLHREDQDAVRAMVEARKAANLDPELLEAHELLAELLLEQGFLETAVRETSSILKRSPRNLRAMDILGTALLYQGNLGRALETVERMILVCPGDPAHHFKRAVLLQQKGNSSEAMKVYLQVLDMHPGGEIRGRSVEAIEALDDVQTRQILVLATEDGLFHAKLMQDAEMAVEERGYRLSPNGLAALEQYYLPDLPNYDGFGLSFTIH